MDSNTDSISNQRELNQRDSVSNILTPELWSQVTPYVPNILLDKTILYPYRAIPWIEPIEGSLVFADISGFTTISEKLAESGKEGAEWLTNIINTYFKMMIDICSEYNGTILKFGGDALLLLFRGEKHATRAVAAAQNMRRATSKYSTIKIKPYRFKIGMTIGIHSGLFWFAVAGVPDVRMQDFILGKQTSFVTEVEAAATGNEILVSQDSYNQIEGKSLFDKKDGFYRLHRLYNKVLTARLRRTRYPIPSNTDELLAYLPPPFIQLLRSDSPTHTIEGLHRKVNIIFIHVSGINSLLEEQNPELLTGELQKYLSVVINLTTQYSGFLVSNDISSTGIKLIVLFGAPIAHEDDSANAFRFALELNNALPDLEVHLTHQIGINNGFVFAGDIGSSRRRQYTVMGDAVNLAARLMSSAKINQILVSRQVALEAGNDFEVEQLAPIKVKGKQYPVQIGSLINVKEKHVIEELEHEGKLYGREIELDIFKTKCGNVENGRGHALHIVGEAGIGKSRLTQEYREYSRERNWKIVTGACFSYTSGKPFAPWILILNSLFNINSSDIPETRSNNVLDVLHRYCSDYIDLASLLNPLLDLDIIQSALVQSLDDETRRDRLFELIVELLRSMSITLPILLSIDNVHWSDTSSIELINRLSASFENSRILLNLTQRPDDRVHLNLHEETSTIIHLGELSDDAALQLVKEHLNYPELPVEVSEVIVSKARGNPLFLEEIVQSLQQSGNLDVLLTASSTVIHKELSLLEIPDRLQSLIMSRIDALEESTKEILRAASVIGNTFELSILKKLFDPVPSDAYLDVRLMELRQIDLIDSEEGAAEFKFRFKQNLIQEVAYDSLLFARRRNLHHRVAAIIEETNADNLDFVLEELVHHYSNTTDDVMTRHYARKAGDKARTVFAHEQAIDYFQLGLRSLRSSDPVSMAQRSFFIEYIGDSLESSGMHFEAAQNYAKSIRRWIKAIKQSLDITEVPQDFIKDVSVRTRKSVLLHKMAVSYERNSDYDLALRQLELALKELPPKQPDLMAKILITRSLSLFRKGRYEEAIYWGRAGLLKSRRSGDLPTLAYAYNILASSYTDIGNIRQAIKYRESAIEIYNELNNIPGLAQAHNNLGASYQVLGKQKLALYNFETSLSLCERIGNFNNTAIAHNNVGEVLLTLGKLDESIDHLNKVVETFELKGNPLAACGLALINMSKAYQRKIEYQKASNALSRGMNLLKKAQARGLLVEGLMQQAELELAASNLKAAAKTCRQALKDTQELGLKLLRARGLHILGRIYTSRGQFSRAEQSINESISISNGIKADYERGIALMHLAELYSKTGKERYMPKRHRKLLKRALAIFNQVEAEADIQEVRQLLKLQE
jgi:class 3 adenylate cyclase/tetratricopeptide (TPR) repeat protein